VKERLQFLKANYGLKRVASLSSVTPLRDRKTSLGHHARSVTSSFATNTDALSGVTVLEIDKRAPLNEVARSLKGPAVQYVQPAPARWLAARVNGPNDPKYAGQWGLPIIKWFDADRKSARQIIVAVLDSGIDRTHPDLKKVVRSYDKSVFSASDLIGHGTHVAGIIAATVNNNIGVVGVADCRLSCWKVFGDKPESDGEIYLDNEAYYRALDAVGRTRGMRVVNLSLGGTVEDKTETKLISDLIARDDILFVVAMGNEHDEGNPSEYPASIPGVLAVGAIGPNRRRAAFSNTGRHIGVVAPGVSILSTLPLKKSIVRPETEYDSWDGTSMATPFVTGAAALAIAKNPGLTARQLRGLLQKKAARVPAMRGKRRTNSYGYGLLNLQSALS
jgi:subtilisin family serine protease